MDDDWLRERSRAFRNEMPLAEVRLWSHLRRKQLNGYKFRRQHILQPYIVDFYCAEARLAIELDGDTHEADRDAARDHDLAQRHIKVIRFNNYEIFTDMDHVLQEIWRAVTRRAYTLQR